MDTKYSNSYFDIALNEKTEIIQTTEFKLTEYMQGIKRIVKSEAQVRILEKLITDNSVLVGGETVYNVLYISEGNGLLKSVSFKEPFDVRFDRDMPFDDSAEYHITVKTSAVNVSAKNSGQRIISVKSRFTLYCEVLRVSPSDFCTTQDHAIGCDIETLKKDISMSHTEFCEGVRYDISEEIKLDEGAPEIAEIIEHKASICIKNLEIGDGTLKIRGKVMLDMLYESGESDSVEYVSINKHLPFETEVDMPSVDSSHKVLVNAHIESDSVSASTDNYGEQKVVEFSAYVVFDIMAVQNRDCRVVIDMYSVKECIVPVREKKRVYSVINSYSTETVYNDMIRVDLRGITDIVYCDVDLSFSNPEAAEGGVYLPAKGYLYILGVKGNGEVEAQSAVLNLRIPLKNIQSVDVASKCKWISNTYIDSYEYDLLGGELSLKIETDGRAISLLEESLDVLTGYETSDTCGNHTLSSGFSLYYPQKGESVWSVAKAHGVSYERLKKENSINGIDFDSAAPVVLR